MPSPARPILFCFVLAWSIQVQAADPAGRITPERLARHALGRADAASRLSACLATRGAELKAVAEALLKETDPDKRESLKAQLDAAHLALTRCPGPLPPAEVGGAPDRVPAARLRVNVLQVEPAGKKAPLQKWIEDHQQRLLACYLPAAARDPLLAGKATYKLSVGPGAGVRLLSTSLANMSVAHCAARALGDLKAPAALGPKLSATVRLVFTSRN